MTKTELARMHKQFYNEQINRARTEIIELHKRINYLNTQIERDEQMILSFERTIRSEAQQPSETNLLTTQE